MINPMTAKDGISLPRMTESLLSLSCGLVDPSNAPPPRGGPTFIYNQIPQIKSYKVYVPKKKKLFAIYMYKYNYKE